MSKNDEPSTAAMTGHYIASLHTLACARRDLALGAEKVPTDAATVGAMDEAITNVAKLVSALALQEMSAQRVGQGVPS